MIYRINEGELDIPAQWADKSVNVFAVGSTLPLTLSFVISREAINPSQDVAEYADEKLEELEHQLKQFKIVEKKQIEIAGTTALEAEFTWRSETGRMYQRQIYVRAGATLLVFTVTSRRELQAEHRAQVEAVLNSLRLTNAG